MGNTQGQLEHHPYCISEQLGDITWSFFFSPERFSLLEADFVSSSLAVGVNWGPRNTLRVDTTDLL